MGLLVTPVTFQHMVSMVYVQWGVVVVLRGIDMEFKDKIILHCFPEMKCQQGFLTEVGY